MRIGPAVGLFGSTSVHLLLVLSAGPASARETWVWPQPGSGEPPVSVRLAIETSSSFPVGESAIGPDRIDSNLLMTGSELFELKSWAPAGRSLVAHTASLPAGTYLFQFALRPKLIKMNSAEFARHLRDDGLAAAARERVRRKEEGAAGRERYTRLGKTLVRVGEPPDDAPEPALAGAGLAYDLVPEDDPTAWETGVRVKVRALAGGKPAIARTVTLTCAAKGKVERRSGTTAADGTAELEVPPGTRCMLHSIDMRRVETDPEADWHSVWHTFTFER